MAYKDPERQREWRKAYYAAHKQKAREDALGWYHAHKNEPAVKAMRCAHTANWKASHQEQYLAARRRRSTTSTRVRQEGKWGPLLARALAAGCTVCHEGDATRLHFHHVASRSFEVAYPRLWLSRDVEGEIRKCMVLCDTCPPSALPDTPLDAYWSARLF